MFIITQNGDAVVSESVKAFRIERYYGGENGMIIEKTQLVADCGVSRVFTLGTYRSIDAAATEMQNVLRQILSKRNLYVVNGTEEGVTDVEVFR